MKENNPLRRELVSLPSAALGPLSCFYPLFSEKDRIPCLLLAIIYCLEFPETNFRCLLWFKFVSLARTFDNSRRVYFHRVLFYICTFYTFYLNMDRKKGSRRSRSEEDFRKCRPKKRKNVFNPKKAETSSDSLACFK